MEVASSQNLLNDIINCKNVQLYKFLPSVDGFQHEDQPEELRKDCKNRPVSLVMF